MFGLPASTLRYYEEIGLLPAVEKTKANQRIYTEEHIGRLGAIRCFKETGMSMAKLLEFFTYEEEEQGAYRGNPRSAKGAGPACGRAD